MEDGGFDSIPSGNGEAQVVPDAGAEEVVSQDVEQNVGAEQEATELVVDEAPQEESQEEVAEEVEAKPEEDVEAAPKVKQKKNGAQERIRELANAKRAAEERAAQVEQYYAQQAAQYQQQLQQQLAVQQQMHERQLAIYEAQAKAEAERREQEQFARLPPEEQVKRRFYKEAAELAKQQLAPELQAAQQKAEMLEQTLKGWQEQARKRQAVNQLMQQATQANTQVFSKSIGEQGATKLAPILQELTLTYHSAFGDAPDAAAAKLQEAFELYHKERLREIASGKTGKKVQVNKQVPKAVNGGGAAAKGGINWPSRDQLNADGRFKNFESWLSAGQPPLRGKPVRA